MHNGHLSSRHNVNPVKAIGVTLAVLALSACNRKYEPGEAKEVMGISMGSVRNAVAVRLDSMKAPSWVPETEWKRVRALYARWNNAPLWLEPDGVRDRANALLKAIEEAPTHALSTQEYPLDSIRLVVNAEDLEKNTTPEKLAEADVMLTSAYVAYATDMLMGQVDPKTISQAWHIPARLSEVDSALVLSLQSPNMTEGLAAMAPQDSGYAVLRSEFARYKQMAAAGGWPQVTGTGEAAKAAALVRLKAEGLPADSGFGTDSVIKLYQERHGLTINGKLDVGTLRALNVSAEDRAKQIGTNLERYRWLPRTLGSRYIVVNVPAFRLEAFNNGQKELEMKTVVGSEFEGRSTPVFSDSMEYVVFRPYWNVTPTIAREEFFPKYGQNLPEGYEVWSEGGVQRIRQRPGDKNSLGLVKFMFPNSFNIYLHDTPAKSLFKLADRAASHGCIRLEKPDKLAEWVLSWDAGQVQSAMHGSNNRTVRLPSKIPVYIVYLTAYERDGHLHFGDDLYDRDEAVEQKMDSTVVPAKTSAD